MIAAADADRAPLGAPATGAIRPGSDAHKTAFCRMLLDTHNPYKPAVIDWPQLDAEARDRLVSLPIWDIAVQTEGKASIRVLSYAELIADPLLREAIAARWLRGGPPQGGAVQSGRSLWHAAGARAGIPAAARMPEWAFMVTGFSECIDSFFAFGLFALARRRGFFPPELVDTFEPVMQEEARHILFFVNWVAWHRRNLPWWRRPWFCGKVAAVWVFLVCERIGLARGAGATPDGDAAGQQLHPDRQQGGRRYRSVAGGADRCVPRGKRAPHGRLRSPRLLRPQVMPRLRAFVRRFLRTRGPLPPAARWHHRCTARHPKAAAHEGPADCRRRSRGRRSWRRSSAISAPAR